MSKEWIGCVVSINCGITLGDYQGQVTSINEQEQSVTISQAYRNGKKSEIDNITICACDIVDLQIIRTREEAHDIVNVQSVPTVLTEETKRAVLPKCPSPVKIVHASPAPTTGFRETNGKGGHGRHFAGNFNGQASPTKFKPDAASSNGRSSKQGRRSPQSERRTMQSPEKEFRTRRNSDGGKKVEGHPRKVTTPRKIEGRRNNSKNQSAFSLPTESIMGGGDFDFEKANAMFDKQAEFEKIENGFVDGERAVEKKVNNYRHDENVLPCQPCEMRQIKVPGNHSVDYHTDSGLVVPSISQDLRSRLIESAEQFGFNTERMVEQFGRSASEMTMQLLGGNCRWVPNNEHQRPTVVFLCGPHLQGALGMNCARHLANHDAKVVVFAPSFVRMNPCLETELQLLESTSASRISSHKDLPRDAVDMVVSALESHDHGHLRGQPWFDGAVRWVQGQRARCLALDPPRQGPAVEATWSLGLVLPLALPPSCGQQYLCDVGLPSGVFSKLGIVYSSPFSHKFFVSLAPAAAATPVLAGVAGGSSAP
ncbi:enhancer of mRNA-decapping protein 3-like [Babylonia areolata]|uniref:enhancer of mRNA-decapping protein 3-like n=1 Tax=Babylonia areolata TaxID=304850 RepID=UPI003FD5AF59